MYTTKRIIIWGMYLEIIFVGMIDLGEALDWLGILDARKCDRGLLAG
jgi:hypothetical protein